MEKNEKLSIVYILIAGILWGTMGAFRRLLGVCGFDSFGVVFVRCLFAALLFGLLICFKDPRLFLFQWKDIWLFLGSGVFSMLFFTVCYFQAMALTSLSVAAILLYTSPCFVMIMAAILFHEKLNGKKILALVITMIGVALVSGFLSGNARVSTMGLLYGIGAGFGYALYSIFVKLTMNKGYSNLTINFYACLQAAIGTGIIGGFAAPVSIMTSSWRSLGLCVGSGLITCFLPYLLYTTGLKNVEAGKAAVVASIEPVVASLVGFLFFGEAIGIFGICGIALVLIAIILINKS